MNDHETPIDSKLKVNLHCIGPEVYTKPESYVYEIICKEDVGEEVTKDTFKRYMSLNSIKMCDHKASIVSVGT